MLRFLIGIISILLHRPKKLTLVQLGRYMYLNLFSSLCVDSDLTRFSHWGYRKQGWFRHSLIDETHIHD